MHRTATPLLTLLLVSSVLAQPFDRRTPVVVAVERASPAVVNIFTERVMAGGGPMDDFFDELWGHWHRDWSRRQRRSSSLGSGVIVDPDGYIITNAHVIRMASRILVQLPGRDEPVPATLISTDASEDLALLQVQIEGPLPWLPLGTSQDLMIGETAIAIGNPFGLQSTVSTGVISAIGRTIQVQGNVVYDDYLQTDASINPGNSGGPLLNINGEVIGINSAIRADAEGIGFAIPVDRVRETLRQLSDPGRLRRTYLGFQVREVGHGTGTALEVSSVAVSGPASRAGIHQGDRITAVSGDPVGTSLQLHKHLLLLAVGDQVTLTVHPQAGGAREVTLTVDNLPLTPDAAYLLARLGCLGRSVSKEELQQGKPPGFLIEEIQPGGPADDLTLHRGDIILGFAAGRRELRVGGEGALLKLVQQLEKDAVLDVIIRRADRTMRGTIRLR